LRGAPLADMKGAEAEHFVGRIIAYLYAESARRETTSRLAGLGDDGAGGGAEEEPFGGAGDAAPGAAAFGDAEGIVALFGERGGLGFFVGEVVLGDGELGLAGLAVEGEVVERL